MGDQTAAGFAHPSCVNGLAIQFLAAAAIYGLIADMPTPSADKQIPGLELTITEAGRATAPYLKAAAVNDYVQVGSDRYGQAAGDGRGRHRLCKDRRHPGPMAAGFKCAGEAVAVLCARG